jgi:4-amino-4-deoxy-L-arabinose transferase-like glycosyltransferase
MTRATAALLAAAVALRVLFAVLFLGHPLAAMVPEDTEAYRTLARAVAAGDWAHPAFAYLSPLYAFVLAPFTGLAPAGERIAVTTVQIAMDAVSVLLLAWIGTRVFGRPAGLLAAGIYAAYGIAVYYCAVLLPVTPMVLLSLLPIAAALLVKTRPLAWWMLPGAAAGLLALVRPNAIVVFPVLLAWTIAGGRAPAVKRAAALAAGLLVVLGPFVLRSLASGSGASPFPVNGGINFYIGNHAGANGMYVSIERVSDLPLQQVDTSIAEASRRAGRSLDARGASAFWLGEGLSFWRESPAAAVRLVLKKAAMLFRAEEIPLNTNYTFARRRLPLLRATLGFGLVMPFALAGAFALMRDVHRRRDPDVLLLLAVVAVQAASVAAFFVSDRYRLPMVPALILFAAHGAWTLAEDLRQRRRTAATLGVVCLLGALAAHYPFAAFTYPEYAKDYFQLGKVHRERGETDRAVALYEQGIALAGDEPEAFVELAGAYYFAGRLFEAEMALRTALHHRSDLPAARRNLAVLLKDQGLHDEASVFAVDDAQRAAIAEAREELRRRAPDAAAYAEEQYALGVRRYGERKLGEARYAFKRALAAQPTRDAAWFALALLSRELRAGAEACAAIEKAATLKPNDEEYRSEKQVLCPRH